MGVSKEVLTFSTQTHGNDIYGTQQVEHGESNNGEYLYYKCSYV